MTRFQRLSQQELASLDDDRLINYIVQSRAVGEPALAREGLAILIYGYEPSLQARARLKLPPHAVEDVVHDALVKAVAAAFDGTKIGQFRSWCQTILDRTIADYYRRAARQVPIEPYPSDNDSVGSDRHRFEPAVDSEAAAVDVQLTIDDLTASLNDTHRQVIDLHVFQGLSAREVADQIDGMTPANVAKIASRFRTELHGRLEQPNEMLRP